MSLINISISTHLLSSSQTHKHIHTIRYYNYYELKNLKKLQIPQSYNTTGFMKNFNIDAMRFLISNSYSNVVNNNDNNVLCRIFVQGAQSIILIHKIFCLEE